MIDLGLQLDLSVRGQMATQRLGKDSYQADVAVRGRRSGAISTAIEEIARIPGVDILSTTQAD